MNRGSFGKSLEFSRFTFSGVRHCAGILLRYEVKYVMLMHYTGM